MQQSNAADKQEDTRKRAGTELLPEENPAAHGGAENAEAAPEGIGNGKVHVMQGKGKAVEGRADADKGRAACQAAAEAVGSGQQKICQHVQRRGSGHQQQSQHSGKGEGIASHASPPCCVRRLTGHVPCRD